MKDQTFNRLAKLMDPNETTAGYLQAMERDLRRLAIIERRLNRIEKMMVTLAKHLGINEKSPKTAKELRELRLAQQQAEENPYVPTAN